MKYCVTLAVKVDKSPGLFNCSINLFSSAITSSVKMIAELFSDLGSTAVLAVALIVVLALFFYGEQSGQKLPPGPTGLPFVGYLPFLAGKPYVKLLELKKKYGPVYSLRLGSHYTVIIADYPLMKEAFAKDAFIGRPTTGFEANKETIESGAFTHLPWKQQRRFALHLFRDLGMGKSPMEIHIAEEIQELLDRIEKEQGKPVTPSKFLIPSTSNNISSLVFGKRRKFDDPKRIMLDDTLKRKAKVSSAVAWLSFFPLLKAVLRFLHIGKQRQLSKIAAEMKQYIREEIEEHKKDLDSNNIKDYMDGYLLEIEKSKHDSGSTFTVPVLEDTVMGFFSAGSGTVRVAVDWLMLVTAALPHVQKKVQKEIDEVIGSERFPSRSDHQKMPYTEAVIMEILRWRGSLPLNFPRCTIEDTKLHGYFIPKNTIVIPVTWAVHMDPDLWGDDVGDFNPGRFLSDDGKEIQKPGYYIPFSMGKRSCPGESLALVEVFMYFTAILQKFNLRFPEDAKPDFEGTLGIGFDTKPYQIHFETRQGIEDNKT